MHKQNILYTCGSGHIMAKLLDDAYRTEHNGDVRERLLLVRRVLVDNEQTARVAENEFHRSRWWAYKWVKRTATMASLFVKEKLGDPYIIAIDSTLLRAKGHL